MNQPFKLNGKGVKLILLVRNLNRKETVCVFKQIPRTITTLPYIYTPFKLFNCPVLEYVPYTCFDHTGYGWFSLYNMTGAWSQ